MSTAFRSLLALMLPAARMRKAQADFYKGKQVRMIVGHPVGGDYDVGGRLLAKHLARHIPGQPTIIVQNMPAAGSIVAANFLYSQAPRDGTVFGSFSRNYPNQALMGQTHRGRPAALQLSRRHLAAEPRLRRLAHREVKTLDDLFTQELIVAAPARAPRSASCRPCSITCSRPDSASSRATRGSPNSIIAIERGEVEGICTAYGQFRNHESHIRDGKLRILLRAEEAPIADLPEVPSIYAMRQDRRAAALPALRALDHRIRPALCAAAGDAEGPRRDHAQGDSPTQSTIPELIAEADKHEARHDLSAAGASGAAGRQVSTRRRRRDRRDQEAHAEFAIAAAAAVDVQCSIMNRSTQTGDAVAFGQGRATLLGAPLVARRDEPAQSAASDLSNVCRLRVRAAAARRRHDTVALTVVTQDRRGRAVADTELGGAAAFLAGSLAMHGALAGGVLARAEAACEHRHRGHDRRDHARR